MKRTKSIRGVEVYETEGGEELVYIRFQAGGRQYREKVGPSKTNKYGRNDTLAEARRLLDQRRVQVKQGALRGEKFRSRREKTAAEKIAAAAEAIVAAQALDARACLRFEEATARFVANTPGDYKRPKEYESSFRFLGRAFAGRYLDTIEGAEVRAYEIARLTNTGPFAGETKTVGPKTPRNQIGHFSALFNYLKEDEGHKIANPCIDFRPRRKKSRKATAYQPKRVPIVPTDEERDAIFLAAAEKTYTRGKLSDAKRAARRLVAVAAVKCEYFLAARPESELCALTHGDVVRSDDPRTRFEKHGDSALGWVIFRTTKTGGDRTVPLHPEAEEALAAVMLPRPVRKPGESPEDFEARLSTWAAAPVFRKGNGRSTKPWDRFSYRKIWRDVLAAVSEKHPRLKTMVFRHGRNAAITDMRAAGTDGAIAGKLVGHSEVQDFEYVQAQGKHAREAILSLGSTQPTVHRGRTSEVGK
jgi:hypothetical protein